MSVYSALPTPRRSSPLRSLLLCWQHISLNAREGAIRAVLGLRNSESPAIEFRGPRGSCSRAVLPPCPRGRQVALHNRERRSGPRSAHPAAGERCPPHEVLHRSGSDSARRHRWWGPLVLSSCSLWDGRSSPWVLAVVLCENLGRATRPWGATESFLNIIKLGQSEDLNVGEKTECFSERPK